MESFSTQGLPVARKVSFWNEITSDTFAELEIAPRDARRFDGTLDRERVGPVTVMAVHSAAARIQHTRAHIARTSEPSFLLLAPIRRHFELTLERAAAVRVNAGEFCLIDHSLSYELAHGDDVRTLCVDVSRRRLEQRLPNVARAIGRVVQPNDATARLLLELLRGVSDEVARSAPLAAPVGSSLLELVVAAYSALDGGGKPRDSRASAEACRAFIDARLTDPELDPASVAAHFGFSTRHLRTLLRADGEPFSVYVLARRLEHCAALLRDPAQHELTITALAFESGFSDATHFGRAFKERFGVTPREYRSADGVPSAADVVAREIGR